MAWKALNERQKAVAGRLFDALSTLDALSEAQKGTRAAAERETVNFADLYAAATRSDRPIDLGLRRALAANATLRADFERLLERTALYHFPRVAAASSGAVDSRDGEGFHIRLKPSRAAENQTYVIIEIADRAAPPPGALILRGPDGAYEKVSLTEPQDGVIQLLAESNSTLVTALRDVDTEVFIR